MEERAVRMAGGGRKARKNVYLRRLLELVVLLLAGTALFALALVCPAVKTVFDAIRPWMDIVFFSLCFLIAACEGIESFRQRRFWRGTGWSVAAIMAAGVLAGECVKIWRG